MSGAELGLALSVFLACAVEAVEALTIVLAVGTTRSWSSAIAGVGAAVLALAAIVLALGPALTSLPIGTLRVLVGGLLLIFGLQWLRKAILRAGGLKAMHDELQAFQQEAASARLAGGWRSGYDAYSFAIAFKGVLLEGLEVAFIVLTFGANQHHLGVAAAAAGLAVLVVVAAGVAARAPLARVPENNLKFAVGVLLCSFGMFWSAEGAGASWPGGDAALPVIVLGVLLVALLLIFALRRTTAATAGEPRRGDAGGRRRASGASQVSALRALALGVWRFVVGDDWRTAVGAGLAIGLTALAAGAGVAAWWVMSLAVPAVLAFSIRRAARDARRDAP